MPHDATTGPAEIVFLDRETLSPETQPPRARIFRTGSPSTTGARPTTVAARASPTPRSSSPTRCRSAPMRSRRAAPPADRGLRHRHRHGRRQGRSGARHRGQQRPELCDRHRARACLRADLRAPPQHPRLSRLGARRALADGEPVLLLRPPDRRPRRRDHRHPRARLARQPRWRRSRGPSAWRCSSPAGRATRRRPRPTCPSPTCSAGATSSPSTCRSSRRPAT